MVIMGQASQSVFIRLFSGDTKPKQLTLSFVTFVPWMPRQGWVFFWQSRFVNLSCKYFDCLVTAAPILVKCLETDSHVLVGGEKKGLEIEKDRIGYQQ